MCSLLAATCSLHRKEVHCSTSGGRSHKCDHWSVKIGIIQYKLLEHFGQYFGPLCDKEEFYILPETQYNSTLTEVSDIFEDCEHWTNTHQRAMPLVLLICDVLVCLPLLSIESRIMRWPFYVFVYVHLLHLWISWWCSTKLCGGCEVMLVSYFWIPHQ